MANIFQKTFSIAFSWMKIFDFRLKFYWSLFLRVQYAIIVSDNGLAPNRRQAIIWTNVGLGCLCIYASLGLNELMIWCFAPHCNPVLYDSVCLCIYRTACHCTGHWQFSMKYQQKYYFAVIKVVTQWSLQIFCTCHNICVVIAGAKNCCDWMFKNWIIVK